MKIKNSTYNPNQSEPFFFGKNKRNTVATIGSFDGVHRGHQRLLSQVRRIADERGLDAIAITFATSPKKVLGIIDNPQLNTTEERMTLLHQLGMKEVVVLNFTPIMAAMTAREFMRQVLKEQLGVKILVIGYDHRFGRGRAEGFDDYVRYGKDIGIEVVRGEVCIENGEPISSTRIRNLLSVGNVEQATQLLGCNYTLYGKVVSGYKEGRKMGFPTANIFPLNSDKLIPSDGVYAVWAIIIDERLSINNKRLPGMLNIGFRPTLNNGRERSIEVHILDFDGDLYDKDITIEFIHRLREEQTFSGKEKLTEQLLKDKNRVRELLATKE